MNRFALAILIIVLASAAGYAMFLRPERAPVPANDAGSQDKNEASNQTSESVGAKTHIVEFRDAGYVPSTLTIKAGDTVQFVNKTAGLFWPASAPHPEHTDFPAFDPKKGIGPGGTYSIMFTEPNTYRYHDHLRTKTFGSVTVE